MINDACPCEIFWIRRIGLHRMQMTLAVEWNVRTFRRKNEIKIAHLYVKNEINRSDMKV